MERAKADRGRALASPSTLNRVELGNERSTRCHKIGSRPEEIEAHLLDCGVRSLNKETEEVVLDFDATDDPLQGRQEGRLFHGYYRSNCYLPLYCFAGDVILWAQLRTSDRAASRVFTEFSYRTQKSWSRERRVIGKAEVSSQGDNPRFIVTNLSAPGFEKEVPGCFEPRALYEDFHCARGQMENMIKQMQLDLHADRTSTHHPGSNQLRLWLSAFGYMLLERLRALCLRGTELGRASVGTIRLRLLKIAGHVNVSVRRVYVRMACACPMQALFAQCQRRLMVLDPAPA